MLSVGKHEILQTHPESIVVNSQTPGIGRLSAIGSLVAVNNLGRNIALCDAQAEALPLLAHFGDTIYPDDDDQSQFDLDMHAIIAAPDQKHLLAVNHHGLIRFLELPDLGVSRLTHSGRAAELSERARLKWPGDVEQFCTFGDHIISGSPQGYAVDDPAQPGILISQSLTALLHPKLLQMQQIEYANYLDDWGSTTALAVDQATKLLAVAFGKQLAIFHILDDGEHLRLSPILFEAAFDFVVRFIAYSNKAENLVIAGYDEPASAAGASDWNELRGGGWATIALRQEYKVESALFRAELAWGNGAEATLLWHDGKTIIGVDRLAGLHAIDTVTKKEAALVSPHPRGEERLGLAHMTRSENTILCGFNRDGYRLHRYEIEEHS